MLTTARQQLSWVLVAGVVISILLLPSATSAEGIYLLNGKLPTSLLEVDLTTSQAVHLLDLNSDLAIFALAMCPDEDSLLSIGLFTGNVARIDLSTTPPVETVLGHLAGRTGHATVPARPWRSNRSPCGQHVDQLTPPPNSPRLQLPSTIRRSVTSTIPSALTSAAEAARVR